MKLPTKPVFGELGGPQRNIPWIGGKPTTDFDDTTSRRPKTAMCYLAQDPTQAAKSYAKRTDGQSTKFKRSDPNYSLTAFASDAKRHMEQHGIDSVFYAEDPADTTAEPIDLFSSHSRYTIEGVTTWVKKAESNYYDDYALDALDDSAEWLLNSIDESLKAAIRCNLPSNDLMKGPIVWMLIVNEVQSSSMLWIRSIEDKFKKLKLSDFKGENVREYVQAAMACLIPLEQSHQLPHDHLLTICSTLQESTVDVFRTRFMIRESEVVKFLQLTAGKDPRAAASTPGATSFRTLLMEANREYDLLYDSSRWGPGTFAGKKKDPVAMMAALTTEVKNLKQKLAQRNNGNSGNGNGNKQDNRKCYNCGEKGHIKPNCPKLKSDGGSSGNNGNKSTTKSGQEWKKVAPKQGDPHEKSVDNKTWKWCGKCARWTLSHKTDEHKDDRQQTGGAVATLGIVPNFEDWIGNNE